ncbi:MAG TPA: xanthine dehydrogenase family protein molybdopterin-binding subunit [Pseudolabrys sp.]|uniref:xanthine dehydrogenase family protein molybdopterin-binding subunit n=1 Tax=Pseudolabrys sp. TaxID=1960880 RepID=UPI002DDD8A19|nr:xanthine dehydrogenase family protein molybdopterin-binding subunit [Pseudolabrys sp.]HEV2630335.1 xanthine dehydrogenase family protein molybdopterin-binding subunit [Pseudolabrys sp.]
MGAQQFGARVARVEDPALLSGRGRFVDDVKLPGMLHACFVRSPHGHARIRGIDAAAAKALPGVHAVFTADDMPAPMAAERMPMLVPNPAISAALTQHCLAREEVCYVGQTVAVVIADSRHIAEDAAALVDVDYDPLKAVSDCREALKDGSPRAHLALDTNIASKFRMAYGDVDAAFASAAHVFSEDIWQHRGGGMAMEARAVIAQPDPLSGLLTVWSATQTPHIGRRMMADLLDRSLESIRVIAPDVGGGFGPKAIFYAEEAVIPAAALKLNRPVKWTEDRREHFMCATQERDQYWNVSIALDAYGKIVGVRGTLLHDTGAFVPWGIIMPYIAAATMPGPYVIPNYALDVTVALTNKVATTPVRGAGRPQAVFAMERLMDRAAQELELDPTEIRRRNFIQPEQMPYSVGLTFRDGKPLVYDSGDYPKAQSEALRLIDHAAFRRRQSKARTEGRFIGIGLANYVEGTGLGPYEGVTVRILPNGKVAVATGATNQGQGTRTTLAQVVADRLGCRFDDIVMTIGDTAAISQGIGAFASRQAVNAGSSAALAGAEVRTQVVKLAAQVLGVPADDIDVEDGMAVARHGNRQSVSFRDLARLAQGMPGFSLAPGQTPGLEHTAYFAPPQAAYCSGTHVVEVEVDPMIGSVQIIDYAVAHDSGKIINPLIVDGQIQGGVAHGIGNALLEWMRYDENAQPLTTTFADYLIPMATDVPTCKIAHVESPSPLNPLGVKGAGEGGTIPAAAAIVAAVEDALAEFGVHFAECPLMPDRIVEALRRAGAYEKLGEVA